MAGHCIAKISSLSGCKVQKQLFPQLPVFIFFLCLQLRAGCISPLKNLRRIGILRVQDFFDYFDSYSFSPDEVDAVFKAVVWPQVRVCISFMFYVYHYCFLISYISGFKN